MSILVTGGAGFIGSHVVVELLNAGESVVVIDNLINSSIDTIAKIKQIAKKDISFYPIDLKDSEVVDGVLAKHDIESVIHFAALKAVGDSVHRPLDYYFNNVTCTIVLLQLMKKHNIKKLVFSSSAAVYGVPQKLPIKETDNRCAISPYGKTKVMCEDIIGDFCNSTTGVGAVNLRYFNPVGCHSSRLIGENPKGLANNLLPIICNVALGKQKKLSIFGNDYPTIDGSCVRDYIHVVDLARGHTKALEYVRQNTGVDNINLGTGQGASVLQVVDTFKKVNGVEVPYDIVCRRQGDPHTLLASVTKAKEVLNWQAELDLQTMCKDHFSFNPFGVE